VEVDGQFYDVMGASLEHELVLRGVRAVHQGIHIEHFAGRPVMLDGVRWRVVSLNTTSDSQTATLQSINPHDPLSKFTAPEADIARLQFPSANGEHTLGRVKHGIVRMAPVASRAEIRVPLKPNDQFEVRLHNRELDGLYTIQVCDIDQLIAQNSA
jgi:hypothetical protein